jgi:hypothetical protein
MKYFTYTIQKIDEETAEYKHIEVTNIEDLPKGVPLFSSVEKSQKYCDHTLYNPTRPNPTIPDKIT